MKTSGKVVAGVASSALLLSMAGMAVAAPGSNGKALEGATHDVNGNEIDSHSITVDEKAFTAVANKQGEFTFNQLGTTPNDDLFNVFGTAITSMCSKPANEMVTEVAKATANYYINIGGDMQEAFSINLADMEEESEEMTMACSCATGAPFGQANVIGIPLKTVVGMANLEDGVNTLTAYGVDGFGVPMPLQYALDHDAMLVYSVNGEKLASEYGPSAQIWMPETVARYFTRNVCDIKLTKEDVVPGVQTVDPMYRNKIEIMNNADACVFLSGYDITFEGVADDLGSAITSIEFSFDNGETWTTCEVADATADKWVNWQFTTSFEEAGDYKLMVRACTQDGVVSPLEASLNFSIV